MELTAIKYLIINYSIIYKQIKNFTIMKKNLLFSIILAILVLNVNLLKAQDVINLSTTDNIGDILGSYAGNNVVLIVPSGYTNPATGGTITLLSTLVSGIKITIKGDGSMPTLALKGFSLPTGINMSLFKFEGLTLTGFTTDPTANYVINVSSGIAVNMDSVVFRNCKASTFRSLVRFQSTSATPDQKANAILIDNCIVSNFADYGVVYNNKSGGLFGSVEAKKSTFYGMAQNVFMCQTNTASVNISDCTFDNVVGASGKAIVDLSTQATPVTFTNCILGKSILASGGLTIKTGGTLTITNSYYTTDWTANAPTATGGITGALTAYANASTSLFKTPTVISGSGSTQTCTTGDYTIIDASFAGKTTAGDPRWYPSGTGVKNTIYSKPIKSIALFDFLGRQMKEEAKGLLIKKITYTDGTTSSEKVFIREKE